MGFPEALAKAITAGALRDQRDNVGEKLDTRGDNQDAEEQPTGIRVG